MVCSDRIVGNANTEFDSRTQTLKALDSTQTNNEDEVIVRSSIVAAQDLGPVKRPRLNAEAAEFAELV